MVSLEEMDTLINKRFDAFLKKLKLESFYPSTSKDVPSFSPDQTPAPPYNVSSEEIPKESVPEVVPSDSTEPNTHSVLRSYDEPSSAFLSLIPYNPLDLQRISASFSSTNTVHTYVQAVVQSQMSSQASPLPQNYRRRQKMSARKSTKQKKKSK